MKPLAAVPAAVAKNVRGVFCDIDDTLTSAGKLSARAYAALERLRAGDRSIPAGCVRSDRAFLLADTAATGIR